MFTLVYSSIAVKPLSGSELLDLLEQSRDKNLRLEVTGLLLYKEGSFMQALEGDEEVVRALYATIRKDRRHHHVLTLLATPVAARQFPDWSMGFKNLGDVQAEAVPGYNPNPVFPQLDEELAWRASIAMGLLATFKQEN